ncbi:MAG: cytochrome c2 [Halioglobus sp.]|jgi:cytochrome c2
MPVSKKSVVLTGLTGLIVICLSYVAGFYTVQNKLAPYKFYRAATKLATERHLSGDTVRPTIFINLNISKNKNHSVPTTRSGSGGALASVRDELIVMNHEGSIFQVLDDSVARLGIEAADSHFTEYEQAAKSDKYKSMYHRFNYFRYNDILAFDSESSGHLVISYTEWMPEEECYGNAIAVLDYPLGTKSIADVSATADDWEVVFRSQPCLPLKTASAAIEGHMAGGRMDHLGGSTIVLGSGDYAWDGLYAPEILAQKIDNDYGKVISIDVISGEHEMVSYGHRNMQGVVVEKGSKKIWAVEHGPRGGDELNLVKQGVNYGWPLETLGTRYNKLPWPDIEDYGRHSKFQQPAYAWVPSVATSSLTQIDNFHSSWDGDLLVGSFKGGMAYRIRIQNEQVVFSEPVQLIEGRIRDIHQHTDGRIVVWSDNESISFVTAGGTLISDTFVDDYLEVANYSEEQAVLIKKTVDACLECHALDPFDHTSAPGLGSMYNANIASTGYANYSAALKGKSGKWSDDNLKAYLTDPNAFAKGTIMPNPQIEDPAIIEAIIGLLKQSNTSY